MMIKKPYGITGSIASGKSEMSNYLIKKGYKIIDADNISRVSNQKGGPAYQKILETFGNEILLENKELDKKKLSKIVFSSSQNLDLLNKITHPIILSEIQKKIDLLSSSGEPYFLDAPLMFETGLDKLCFKTVLIYCSENIQLARLMERDSIDKTHAEKIIASQMSMAKKRPLADIIIENNADLESFHKRIDEFLKEIA